MEEKEFYQQLLQRYIRNEATDEELKAFFQLLREGKLDGHLVEALGVAALESDPANAPVRKILTFRLLAAAAIIVLAFCAAGYLLIKKDKQPLPMASIQKKAKALPGILPGGDKAVLTLADGSKIVLDSKRDGMLAQQDGATVSKQDRQLIYNRGAASPDGISYNTITTPRGGQYEIVLSDGTRVWLNSVSTLRFPAAFAGGERRVELTGEGYFEVAQNINKPFIVKEGSTEVKVLGTHFNVNAYDEEPEMKITLLEGSIQVSKDKEKALLRPGEQANIRPNGGATIRIDKEADMEQVVAWKNGAFQFEGADIEEVMRQIARWYDVDVVYQGTVNQHFRGTISRQADISKVLAMLAMTGTVHFNISDKKIFVTP